MDSFTLLASASVSLPASGETRTLGSYKVTCSGGQKSFSIKVRSGSREIMDATVDIRDNKPYIVGGLPAKEGKQVLVFVAR